MKRHRVFFTVFSMILFLAGCVTVQTEQEWKRLRTVARDRTGQEIVWKQSEEEERSVQKEIDQLLSDGLSEEDAVRIAMINNRELQGEFETVGISKSDLIQAGLFTNPSLDVLFRFPSGGGRTNMEATGFLPISDLWQIPYRKKAAEARLEATLLRVAQKILDTAAEAKRAYVRVHYLSKTVKEVQEILQKFHEISDEVVMRRDFGLMGDQEAYHARITVIEAETEWIRMKTELAVARSHLHRILGFKPSQMIYAMAGNEEKQSHPPDMEDAVQFALDHRPDVQVARFGIRQAEEGLNLEKTRVLKQVGLGASYEQDVDGTKVFGPAVDIQIPLFDQNQARIARAEYKVRQSQKVFQALEGRIRDEVVRDLERIHLLQVHADSFQEKIVPLWKDTLKHAETWVGAMQLNRLYLLEAQKGILKAQREHLETQMELRHAWVDLELHLGGRLPRSNVKALD